jgi:hypothetical protein
MKEDNKDKKKDILHDQMPDFSKERNKDNPEAGANQPGGMRMKDGKPSESDDADNNSTYKKTTMKDMQGEASDESREDKARKQGPYGMQEPGHGKE